MTTNPFAKHCTITPAQHGSPEWLLARRQLVTASDIPILLGSVSYKTPLQLFYEKKNGAEQETRRQMEYGLHLESLIASWMAEDLQADKVELVNWLLVSRQYPFLGATIDTIVKLGEHYYPGEIKTAVFGSFESEDSKLSYCQQIQAQLIVTGAEHGYLAILPSGNANKLIVEKVEADPLVQASIIRSATDFFDRLEADREPVAKGDDLAKLHYNPDADKYTPDSTFLGIYELYSRKKAELDAKTDGSKILEAELKDLKASMAQMMGESPQSLFFWKDREVFISRKEIKVKEQIKPAYSYHKIDIKEK